MSELAADFQSLPPEYQDLIRRAQDRHQMSVTPLQKLVGGWSGALVYLVSVLTEGTPRVEHLILKLDHKSKFPKLDEVARHQQAMSSAPPGFARDHIARIAFERLERDGAIAIFYGIAGQSLLDFRPLSRNHSQGQLKAGFAAVNELLLSEWNAGAGFKQSVHPQELLKTWLAFRLDAGGGVERFFQEELHLPPDVPGLLIHDSVFHNPLLLARQKELWDDVRPLDCLVGFLHGDLNTNNILLKFSGAETEPADAYLIDFALFKDDMPLLYDQRYLEISYLTQTLSQVSFEKCAELLTRLADADSLEPHHAPVEMAGVSAVIAAARASFEEWLRRTHPSLYDDLWGQYWLAGVAAGLAFCHKGAASREERLTGLMYAAANLKRYAALFPLPSPGEVRQLYSENREASKPRQRPTSRQDSQALHNLPAQPTTFVGRGQEIATAREMLGRKELSLLTLTGPGGTGKTRLSLEIARGLLDHFGDGVFFVALADITEPSQVVSRVAQQLEVREAGSQPLFQNLKDYLRDKKVLLLLDNFEQLIPAAPVVAELLAAAPSLKVLVTSRIRLGLRGEHELPIQPLDVPEVAEAPFLEHLAANESVKLFVERAGAVQPLFRLTAENAAAVAQICQRLDGLPLALELAAARVKLLPPQALLARLGDRLKLLTGGAQDLPTRQQTLRNTLDWSYGLLKTEEKTLYARLAVFVGGFMLEDAEAVCNLEENFDILEVIASLVDNSLLKQEETITGEPRFRMLDTIREYALERLVESGEMPVLQKRHAEHYVALIRDQASAGLTSHEATNWLNRMEREHDNLQAVLAWCLTTPQGRELALSVLATLTWFWYRRGFFNEGRVWTERFLAASGQEAGQTRAAALQMYSRMAMWRGDLNKAVSSSSQSLTLWQRLEDEQKVPMSLMETGVTLLNMGKDTEAHTLLKEAEALFQESQNTYFHAITLVHLGNAALGLGQPVEARQWLDKAYPIFKSIGEEWGLSFVLNNMGEVARVNGDYERAHGYYTESEALLRSTGDKGDLARLVHTLGYISAHQGADEKAASQFRASLAMFRRLGNKRGIAECIAGLASLRAKQGDVRESARMLAAAEALMGESGAAWWPADRIEVERTRALLEASLSAEELAASQQAGKEMTLEQAIALASNEP